MKPVTGSAGLATNFTLWGGCLFKENHYVYSKLWAAALRDGIISESWAINQLWGLVTGLLLFRRVGGTEERGRKGEKGAGSGPSQCGNNSDPRSRKVAWEVALRWRRGWEGRRGWCFHGTGVMGQSWTEIYSGMLSGQGQVAWGGRINFLDGHPDSQPRGREQGWGLWCSWGSGVSPGHCQDLRQRDTGWMGG